MLLVARYVIPVNGPHIEHGAVLVRDDSIVAVGAADDLRREYPGESERDFGLAAIMPGFIDLHTHLEYSVMRGLVDDLPYSRWKLQVMAKEVLLSPEDWEDSALLGAFEAVRSGITTIADITGTGASARAAAAAGIRAHVYREVATMVRSEIDEVMESARDDLDSWASLGPNIRSGIAPHAPYSCHPELYSRVAEFAIDRGLPVSMHIAGSREEYNFVKYGSSLLAIDYQNQVADSALGWLPTGVSPIRYVLQWGLMDVPDLLAVHCTQLDDGDIEVLAEKDVALAFCPRCNAKLAMGMAPLNRFLQAGVRVGIGTDSPASNNVMDVFEEMRVGLLLQRSVLGEDKWLTARQFVRLATLDAARALRVDDRLGSLEPGKQADIIAVDLSHSHQVPTHYPYSAIVHTANQEDVLFTMVAGVPRYDSGEVQPLDRDRILARAEEIREKLRK